MPRPGRGFDDFSSIVDAKDGAVYVTVDEDVGKFIYADLFPSGVVNASCIATITTVNGVVGRPTVQKCEEWQYPERNPCLAVDRTKSRFVYSRDQSKFIQCDLQNKMYLTECPPGDSYFSPECEVCVGGPDSPFISGCGTKPPDNTYCGLAANPCTRENILQGNFFFACPIDETTYLHCNTWGHAYVQSCPENEVWRQNALTCEYMNTGYNPCGTAGVRYYPYPSDHTYFVDCGIDMVPVLKQCQLGLVWNPSVDTCDYPPGTTPQWPSFTHLTQRITLATQAPFTGSGGGYFTPDPGTGLVSRNYAYPCTKEAVSLQKLYWPYQNHPHQYIQCDLWGDSYVRSCQGSFTFNPASNTCVNGPIDYTPSSGNVG
ncbi:uncharacterized protein [Littorina saxatilis]|uniref:uncharacterized protein n=1 Tax=Littorina saxatilis TaxID=31220 RepID=UPI0038B5B930